MYTLADKGSYHIVRDEKLSVNRFQKPPSSTRCDSDTVSNTLCPGCTSLDLPKIVAGMRAESSPWTDYVGLPPWTDSTGMHVAYETCAMCALFSENRDPEGEIMIEWMEAIHFGITRRFSPLSSAAVVFCDPHWSRNTVFEIVLPQDAELGPSSRLLNPNSIDFNRIRHWLQLCSRADLELQPHAVTHQLSGFRLVHCASRQIIEPPQGCLYVALSYVWGKVQPEQVQNQRFPQTIEDAIRVCLELGFEYIWIDRYCIDQNNHDAKHTQISQMDVIYSAASLVIIAAAGDDPEYGLPGVGSRARTPQQSIKLEDCTLLQIFPEPDRELEGSTWLSRGWTLQEGYFAPRKLIFTDQQVTYICKHGVCTESVTPRLSWDETLRVFCPADEHECGRQHDRKKLEAYFSFESRDSPKSGIVTEFTKRKLSYESDIYNACLGILNSWRRLGPSNTMGHIFGIPVEDYGLDLVWEGENGPVPRRQGFPTWSWLSRPGPIYFSNEPPLASVFVQTGENDGYVRQPPSEAVAPEQLWVSIAEYSFQKNIEAQPSAADDSPRLLRLSGWCPRVCMITQPADSSQFIRESECRIEKPDGYFRFKTDSIRLDRHDLTQAEWERCLAVLVGSTQDLVENPFTVPLAERHRYSFLLLCPTIQKGMYERVGVFFAWPEYDSETNFQSIYGTPDWDNVPSDNEDPGENPQDLEDCLPVSLRNTHDLLQRPSRTHVDQDYVYNFANDLERFKEDPETNQAYDSDFSFSWEFPDWEKRVIVVR